MEQGIISSIAEASGLEQAAIAKILVKSKDQEHGDYAFPCFILAKEWKLAPPVAAQRLADCIKLAQGISSVKAVGPYLNFFLNRSNFAGDIIRNVLAAKFNVGKEKRGDSIILEYASLNIAKPAHIGHLRNLCLGHALDNIYRHLGYKLTTIDHIGDYGTQFGIVWMGCSIWGMPESSLEGLLDRYLKASNLKEDQEKDKVKPEDQQKPNVTEGARNWFRSLEAGNEEAKKFWKWCVDISLDYLHRMYARLGIALDITAGESFYSDKLPAIETYLKSSGVLQDSEGDLGVDLGKSLGFLRIFAEGGRSLYITRDIAAAMYRHDTYKAKKILYVVDVAQTLHFRQLQALMEKLGHPVANEIEHVAYGRIPGMSTRKGTLVPLIDFVDEAKERALETWKTEVEKRPEGLNDDEVAEKIAVGATCFYMLSHSRVKDFNFNWTEALSFQGDSGPYLQYALARLYSIEGKARDAGIEAGSDFNAELLKEDEAHALVSLIERFSEVLQKVTEDNDPAHLTFYLLELAKGVSAAYRRLRVVGEEKELAKARLTLFVSVKYVLHTGLTLIGAPALEKM